MRHMENFKASRRMVMAGAAGRSSGVGERRKKRALDAFRNELADLDAEEIQARLDGNRIRSAERRAMARDRLRALRSKDAAAAPRVDERGDENEHEGRGGDDGEPHRDETRDDERAAAEGAAVREKESPEKQPREKQPGNGQDQLGDAAGEDVVTEQDEAQALPLARRIGRLVGMTAAVGGVVLAGAWLIRR
jgi:hypothetical protein